MATAKGKPMGYFDYLLAIDCETTGISFNSDDPSVGHQAVSWGIIVADAHTLKPIEELYVEIKWNDELKRKRAEDPEFGKQAERIHGLTLSYLDENGLDEEEAVLKIGELILKYWGPEVSIRTLGHNVHLFDLAFLKAMFRRHGIELRFGCRHMDSNSLGFGTVGSFRSDDLFTSLGLNERRLHNSLDDARMALESFRRVRVLWNNCVGVNAYENI